MSLINTIIPPQAFEIVLPRIGEILATELPNQATLSGNNDINAKVFVERLVPFDHTDLPAVNVCIAQGDMGGQSAIQSDGTYTFYIDVHTKCKSVTGQKADLASSFKLYRLLGLVRAILEDTRYQTLGFAAPFIMRRYVQQIGIQISPVKDTVTAVVGRVTFMVKVAENNGTVLPLDLAGYTTTVKLEETEKGYLYIES